MNNLFSGNFITEFHYSVEFLGDSITCQENEGLPKIYKGWCSKTWYIWCCIFVCLFPITKPLIELKPEIKKPYKPVDEPACNFTFSVSIFVRFCFVSQLLRFFINRSIFCLVGSIAFTDIWRSYSEFYLIANRSVKPALILALLTMLASQVMMSSA